MTEAQETRTQAAAHTAAEQASQLGDAAREQAGELASSAREHTADLVGAARDEGAQLVGRARQAVDDEARQRTDELARSVRRFGDGLGALAEGRPEDAGPVIGYARDAAQRVDQLAQRLESRGYDGAVQDVSSFARRRPGVFLLSAGALGFAVGRVIRSGGASPSSSAPSSAANGAQPFSSAPDMSDATVSMQPVMPRGEPSSIPPDPVAVPTGSQLR